MIKRKPLFVRKTPKRVKVTISSKCINMLFAPCDLDYIKNHCRGSCCRNTKNILNVVISPHEQHHIESLGGKVNDGFLQPNENETWCPFQRPDGLCNLHKKGKPLGCAISPFNLNNKNTLIVRYRNLSMNCHKNGTIKAYKVFEKSLEIMFGKRETKRIYLHFDNGGEDLEAFMFGDVWEDLKFLSQTRKGIQT